MRSYSADNCLAKFRFIPCRWIAALLFPCVTPLRFTEAKFIGELAASGFVDSLYNPR
ncbi:MAG TPA: hypothetical protein VH985_09990 [Candidatus Binatia bacterium]|jgi:hypothetical protein